MFGDNCCSCNLTGAGCFFVQRQLVGFAEYVISHDTDNPVTYFTGRRYTSASYEMDYTANVSITGNCVNPPVDPIEGGQGLPDPSGGQYPCVNTYSFSRSSTLTGFNNIPSSSGTGDQCGGAPSTEFASGGYFAEYYEGISFGLIGGGDSNSSSGNSCADIITSQAGTSPPLSGSVYCWGCLHDSVATLSQDLEGSGRSVSGSLTSTNFTGIGAGGGCVQTVTVACSEGTAVNPVIVFTDDYSSEAQGNLTEEFDYAGFQASVFAGITTVWDDLTTTGCSYYKFKDFDPSSVDPGDYPTTDFTPFDGSITTDGITFVDLSFIFNSDCTDIGGGPSNFPGSVATGMPFYAPYSATWWNLGSTSPGADSFGTNLCTIAQAAMGVTLPYIFVTFIIMNDGSMEIDDSDSPAPCVDGTATGTVIIPQPDAITFPDVLYTTDPDTGDLVGPIGRLTVIIPGFTCADWDGSLPLPP